MLEPEYKRLPDNQKYVEQKIITTTVDNDGRKSCEIKIIERKRDGDNWSTAIKTKYDVFDSHGNKIEYASYENQETMYCIYN